MTETVAKDRCLKRFTDFWRGMKATEKARFAQRVGAGRAWLTQVGGGHSKASPELAKRIERESNGVVKAEDLRPDVFGG